MSDEAFDRYAAKGTTVLDMAWGCGRMDTLCKQIEDMVESPDEIITEARALQQDILEGVTAQIHDEVCSCNDKRCTLWSEIADWLTDGDWSIRPYVLAELVAEWKDFAEYQPAWPFTYALAARSRVGGSHEEAP